MNKYGPMLVMLLGLAGCVATDTVRSDDPEINRLQAATETNPQDLQSRAQLTDAYLKRYAKTRDISYRDSAMRELRRMIDQAPGHVGANVTLYRLLLAMSLQDKTTDPVAEMRDIYGRTQILRESPLPPPSLVAGLVALKDVQHKSELPRVIKLIKPALQENPRHSGTRLLLAQLYAELGHDTLALAMLEQAHTLDPDNAKVLRAYGNQLYRNVRSRSCEGDNGQLGKALGIMKKAAGRFPDEPRLQFRLSKLYEMRGMHELALFSAKRLRELEDNLDNQVFLAEQYANAGRRDEAAQLIAQLLHDHPDKSWLHDTAGHIHFQYGEWPQARASLLRYVEQNPDPSPYAVMLLSLTDRMLADPQVAATHLRHIPDASFDNGWQRTLVAYLLDETDEAGLLAQAGNTCEQVEGHYYIGMRRWLAHDRDGARAALQKVVALNVPFYYEDASARFLLAHLDGSR